MKLLTNFENAYWNPSLWFVGVLAVGKMSKNLLVTGGFRFDFTESQEASCKHFQCQNRCFVKRVTALEGFLKLVSNFKGASRNFECYFFYQIRNIKCKNYQRSYRNYLLNIISLQKIFISWHNPFKGTQDWDFFWLWFWNLYYFFISFVKILRFYKKNFWSGHYCGRYDFPA